MEKKQFLIIGLGRFGSGVAKELYKMGHQVLGVDIDESSVEALSDYLTHGLVGDVTNESFLKSLGATNFDAIIVGIGSDYEASILTVMTAKELGVKRIIAKASSVNHMKVLYRLGADKVIVPEEDVGRRLAHNLTFNSKFLEFIELSEDFSIMEIEALEGWWGKSLFEANIRAKYFINIIAIRRQGEIIINPQADEKIEEGDHLFVLGENEALLKMEAKNGKH